MQQAGSVVQAEATMIKGLFAGDIYRRIEEVIKVDADDDQLVREEIQEYVATQAIRSNYLKVLERYRETPTKPHEGIGIWVSGFFGSGKSSFAKMLGLAIADRPVGEERAAELFGARTGDTRIQVLLKTITEQIPTETVIFDVSTDRGIRSGNQMLTEIMYRLFLQHLGYAKDLDLAELEITLEADQRLDEFKEAFRRVFPGKEWDQEKNKVALAIAQASRVMHELEPDTFPAVDTWVKAAANRSDITAGLLGKRCMELMKRRRPGKSLVFVVDEVGQFVARDVQKMLDLQGIIKSLGQEGRGKLWAVVTSQEKLGELVSGLDNRQVELARLMDRFPQELQVHLEPSDISEVTSRRVLAKNASAEQLLRELFESHRGRLTGSTRLSADIRLPDLTSQGFVDLYPFLPYQIDLIIQVVSGLRTQGGASRHVGGANRTIIKLAQQILINPAVLLAESETGRLVRLDQVYDLVEGNIDSDIRAKIAAIPKEVAHPLAQAVAKAVCLLQYTKSIHRTAENIAAVLHPAVDADSRIQEVKEALNQLIAAHKVRLGDDGYRIPSPAEDDWERQRAGKQPQPAEAARIQADAIAALWQPQPSCDFLGAKVFKAGLVLNGKAQMEGDVTFHLFTAPAGPEFDTQIAEARTRSQSETRSVFWAASIDEAITFQTDELFRSRKILELRERAAQGQESALVAEEKLRMRRHEGELRRLLKAALLGGSVYFNGNDRSPTAQVQEVNKAAETILLQVLPEVFSRFSEMAARIQKKDLEAILTSQNLHGLTAVFAQLNLIQDQQGKPVFRSDSGPLDEVFRKVENQTSYGEMASGRFLEGALEKEPYGWDFDAVRLLVAALLRAGKIEATSQGQTLDSALSVEAKNLFSNNNLFRQASFRPKAGLGFEQLVKVSEAFQHAFGKQLEELEESAAAAAIRTELARPEEDVRTALGLLTQHKLPGSEVLAAALDQIKAIRTGKDASSIATFNACYNEVKEAIRRAAELTSALTEPAFADIARARRSLDTFNSFLATEPDLPDGLGDRAGQLQDRLAKESFFRELPWIDQDASAIDAEYQTRYQEVAERWCTAYDRALADLEATPGWEQLDDDQRQRIRAPLAAAASGTAGGTPIPQMRSDFDACQTRLAAAIEGTLRVVEGARLVKVQAASYFAGGVESPEQLEAALNGLKDECSRLIGQGKKVLVQ